MMRRTDWDPGPEPAIRTDVIYALILFASSFMILPCDRSKVILSIHIDSIAQSINSHTFRKLIKGHLIQIADAVFR